MDAVPTGAEVSRDAIDCVRFTRKFSKLCGSTTLMPIYQLAVALRNPYLFQTIYPKFLEQSSEYIPKKIWDKRDSNLIFRKINTG
jgi:hypothetical protein